MTRTSPASFFGIQYSSLYRVGCRAGNGRRSVLWASLVLPLGAGSLAGASAAEPPVAPAAVATGVAAPPVEHRPLQPEKVVASAPVMPSSPAELLVPNAAYRWLDVALEATARDVTRSGARPTVLSRTLAIVCTAMFDAWAAYDERAVGTCLGASLRRPFGERTLANKEKAISYAAYRALLDVYPQDAAYCAEQMRAQGLDPEDALTDLATPSGIGNRAAEAVVASRHHDGANQLGDEPGCNGKPYSDTSGYKPANPPDSIVDPNCWQPITFEDGKGGHVTPGYLTPHWRRVRPFGLLKSDQFLPPPPPRLGSPQLQREIEQVIEMNATLDPERKALVEFMRDGPRSTGQSGHWLKFAQAVSRRDKNTLDQDVKLFFALSNIAMDAFIACWDTKSHYDSSRPWTLVHTLFAGQKVRGWGGPGKGTVWMKGEEWRPFSPLTFVTPPFPGYVSGHSTVSAACAETLRLFTGSDAFGAVEQRKAGELTEPDVSCLTMQGSDGKDAIDTTLSCDVALRLPTFTATAEMAGLSRILGGYHIESDNVEGLKLGRKVAAFDWQLVQKYFQGTAKNKSN